MSRGGTTLDLPDASLTIECVENDSFSAEEGVCEHNQWEIDVDADSSGRHRTRTVRL